MISQFGSVNIMLLVGWLFRVPFRLARYETKSASIEIDTKLSSHHLHFLRLRKMVVFNLASKILADSQSALEDLENTHHINRKKIQVFYNYLSDPLDEEMLSIERVQTYLVCVGRFSKNKGQDVLINALALLPPRLDIVVEFVGRGEFMRDCQQLACSLGVEDRCRFVGSVSHNRVFDHFARASASVVPSLDEAFGYVCIESLAVGTPVIGSRVGGIPEIVRDKKDGFLFKPGDAHDLANKIQLFFTPENDRPKMQSNARQRFLSTFEQKKFWTIRSVYCYRN